MEGSTSVLCYKHVKGGLLSSQLNKILSHLACMKQIAVLLAKAIIGLHPVLIYLMQILGQHRARTSPQFELFAKNVSTADLMPNGCHMHVTTNTAHGTCSHKASALLCQALAIVLLGTNKTPAAASMRSAAST